MNRHYKGNSSAVDSVAQVMMFLRHSEIPSFFPQATYLCISRIDQFNLETKYLLNFSNFYNFLKNIFFTTTKTDSSRILHLNSPEFMCRPIFVQSKTKGLIISALCRTQQAQNILSSCPACCLKLKLFDTNANSNKVIRDEAQHLGKGSGLAPDNTEAWWETAHFVITYFFQD